MQHLLRQIQIKVNDKIYLKDPESSALGKNLVAKSIEMIHDMGFESFTFKKVATELQTTESTVYRYFENKHKLLIYLISWYWGWLEYEMVFFTMNISDPVEKLKKTIDTICEPLKSEADHDHVNLRDLYEIVIAESPKAYLTKEVDTENKNGLFSSYKQICERLKLNIEEINPDYKYSNTLASTLVEGAISQRFFALHLPKLTNINQNGSELGPFFTELTLKTIQRDK